MHGARVSIVIPTYNRASMLARALDSVLAQTHENWEALVIDDGSTDNTAALVAERYGGEPRIRYCYQGNGGAPAARNRAMEMAGGEFIAFLDSDDAWEPWKLELQLACFEVEPELGMVWTNMAAVDGEGRVVDGCYLAKMYRSRRLFTDEQLFDRCHSLKGMASCPEADQANLKTGCIFSQMITGSLVHTSTVLLRRNWQRQVGLFNPDYRPIGEDFDFHLRTTRLGRVGFVDVSSTLYQIGLPGALTERKNIVVAARNFLRTIEPIIEKERDKIKLPDSMIRETLAYGYGWYGTELALGGERQAAREALLRSLHHHWSAGAALFLAATWLHPAVIQALRRLWRLVKRVRRRAGGQARPPVVQGEMAKLLDESR